MANNTNNHANTNPRNSPDILSEDPFVAKMAVTNNRNSPDILSEVLVSK